MSGWSGPSAFSRIASARRCSGSASPGRPWVGSSCTARLLRAVATWVMIGAEHLLPDCQRAAAQRLGLPRPGSVALSNAARLLRSRVDVGVVGVVLTHSSDRYARRYSGSASLTRCW